MDYLTLTPGEAYQRARDVIKGRWPEAEPIIMKDAQCASRYALEIIKGPWSEAEPFIMQNGEYAYDYAVYVLKQRWIEAEPYIAQCGRRLEYVIQFFGEPVFIKEDCSDFAWNRAGAIGYFAPVRLFVRKSSVIDTMLDNETETVL